jgi:pyruvate dehydrogenase E1 component alpha subunit
MLGANGIVGAGIPIAVGAALTCQYRRTGGVSVAFFGDGAANQGAFHEAANLAALWRLPVLLVCENNGYGEATPAEFATSVRDVADRASAYGMPGVIADGMDFFDVREKAALAIARARRGDGPTLLECKTYRFHGHYVGDTKTYRPAAEEEAMRRERDPLGVFEHRVVSCGALDSTALRAIDVDASRRIREAVTFARSSPEPEPEELHRDVYGKYGA